MSIKKQLKDLQYKLLSNRKIKKEDQIGIIAEARKYIKELEEKLEGTLGNTHE